ncbi:MAG: hypothetical protein AAF417_00460 [Pseudomonadota bacterium]
MSYTNRLALHWRDSKTEVATDDRRFAEAIAHIYGPFIKSRVHGDKPVSDVPPEETWTAVLDCQAHTYDDFDHAVLSFEYEIERRLLRDLKHGVLLHAGAVTNGERTYIFSGQSGAGKSTITLDFVRRGYRYLTDEFVALSVDGAWLYPFPRAATVKRHWPHAKPGELLELNEEYDYRGFFATASGNDMSPVPLENAAIVFLERSPDEEPDVRILEHRERLAQLLCSTFELVGRESDVWPAISTVAATVRACKLRYRDCESDLNLALEVLEQ